MLSFSVKEMSLPPLFPVSEPCHPVGTAGAVPPAPPAPSPDLSVFSRPILGPQLFSWTEATLSRLCPVRQGQAGGLGRQGTFWEAYGSLGASVLRGS